MYFKVKDIGGINMSCHGDNKGNHESHNHRPLKHLLHMVICCGLPIIILSALPLIARYSPEAGAILGRIAPFICPVMMFSMFVMMFRNNKNGSCCDDAKRDKDKQVETNSTIG